MIFKMTLFLVMMFCYIITKSNAALSVINDKDSYTSTTNYLGLENTIAKGTKHDEIDKDNKFNSKDNITKSVTDMIEIEPVNEIPNAKVTDKLTEANDKYKVLYLKCDTCPDEAAEEKIFWDNFRQKMNLNKSSAVKLLAELKENTPNNGKDTKNNKNKYKIVEVKVHGDDIEIKRLNGTEKDLAKVTDFRRYGIDNIETMNSENFPLKSDISMDPYLYNNKKVDSRVLNTLRRLRNVRQYRLSVPGAGNGPDVNYKLRSSNVETPKRARRPDGPHGAGASLGTLLDYND